MRKAFKTLEQKKVDFLIPFYEKDIRLTIDPALIELFDEDLYEDTILKFVKHIFKLIGQRASKSAESLINFPEVNEIRLGYASKNKYGKGNGIEYNQQIFDFLMKKHSAFIIQELRIEMLYW